MIGLLLLMGIVKKNSIILVDYANHARETEGADGGHGDAEAGPVRLRPILMTTIATLMAALPAALPGSSDAGSSARRRRRWSIAAALLVGRRFTWCRRALGSLLVVPAFYVAASAETRP
jgi:multidrug efflux pump